MCLEIENRIFQPSLLKIEKPEKLYQSTKLFQKIISILEVAFEQDILKIEPHIIRSLVKLDKSNEFKIEGGVNGAKNFKRIKNLDSLNYLERVDGCWFDFSIIGIQTKQSIEIIGFNFEIRFPDQMPSGANRWPIANTYFRRHSQKTRHGRLRQTISRNSQPRN